MSSDQLIFVVLIPARRSHWITCSDLRRGPTTPWVSTPTADVLLWLIVFTIGARRLGLSELLGVGWIVFRLRSSTKNKIEKSPAPGCHFCLARADMGLSLFSISGLGIFGTSAR